MPAASSSRLLRALALIAGASLLGLGLGTVPAAAAGTGSISGVITAGGAPAPGLDITMNSMTSGFQSGQSDGSGNYSFSGLSAGDHWVSVDGGADYQPWNDTVTLDSDSDSVVLDITLAPWRAGNGTIEGSVVDSVSGEPISGAEVRFDSFSDVRSQSATVGTTGAFEFTGIPTGVNYSLYVQAPGYAPQNLRFSFDEEAGQSTTFELVALDAGISGVVRSGGVGVQDVSVLLEGPHLPGGTTVEFGVTGPDGSYSFPSIGAGEYTVTISGYVGMTWVYREQQRTIVVPAQTTATADFDLEAVVLSTVGGTVTDLAGNPLKNICVHNTYTDGRDAPSLSDPRGRGGGTAEDGSWSLTLDAGSYKLAFWDCEPTRRTNSAGTTPIYAATYYDGSPSSGAASFAEATAVTVNGTPVTIDMKLEQGAGIGGLIQLQTPTGVFPLPMDRMQDATLYQKVGDAWELVIDRYSFVGDAPGAYQSYGLLAGSYRVCIEDTVTGPRAFAHECWENAATPAAGTDVVVTAGQFLNGIDIAVGIPVPGFDPVAVPTADLDPLAEDGISAPENAQQGQQIDVEVGSELAGEWVAVFGHSTPMLMGSWVQVPLSGIVRVPVPSALPPGAHTLVAQTADGGVIGWQGVTVAAGARAAGSLSVTGAEFPVLPVLLAAGGVLAGIALLAFAATRRRTG